MPELPEVETVCRGLRSCIMGRVFQQVELFRPDLRIPFPADFTKRLTGRRITAIHRRAKYILISLEDTTVLIIHLGMSGRVVVYPARRNCPERHDHVVFNLDDGKEMVFNDPRRFGLMTLVGQDGLDNHPLLASLGIEPLGEAFTAEWLSCKLKGKKLPVKQALMDNHIVVGIGNIYACESLFRAGISPFVPAGMVAKEHMEKLVTAIKMILQEAILSGGSTLRDYVRSTGDAGYFQHHFAVYGKEGQPCARCGRAIMRARQAGRSSFYCPGCQVIPDFS